MGNSQHCSNAVTIQLRSPHPFPERLLLFGGGGSGKTEALLQIARHIGQGHVRVYENDISFAWDRALATDFQDVDQTGKVTIERADNTWENTLELVTTMVDESDADAGDWIVLDSMTPTWEQVRTWYLKKVYGEDASSYLINLKAEHANDLKAYNAALSASMNYDIINQEYFKLYHQLFLWGKQGGNLAVTAEAAGLGGKEDAETAMIFGHLGVKPAGQKKLHHVASTNLFLVHKSREVWTMSTAKDRNRDDMENAQVDDFALDYLVQVAGWKPMPVKKAGVK